MELDPAHNTPYLLWGSVGAIHELPLHQPVEGPGGSPHGSCLSARTQPQQASCRHSNTKLTTAVETYLTDLRRIQASGGATGELSYYGPLEKLLNDVGKRR